MACGKAFAITLIFTAATIVGSAIATVSFTNYLINPTTSPILFDPAWSAVLAVVLAAVLFKVKDSNATTQAEASALFSLGTFLAVMTPPNVTRLFLVMFATGSNLPSWYVPIGIEITASVIAGVVALIIAIKEGKRIQNKGSNSLSYASTGIDRYALSIFMVILGVVIFGIATAILQERWGDFSAISIHFHSVVIFATGVIGLVAEYKDVPELNVWHKTMATFASGISGAAIIVLVQNTNGYSSRYTGGLWSRADFVALNFTQAVLNMVGVVTTVMSALSSHFPHDTATPTKSNLDVSSRNVNNAGLLGSGLLAGGMAAFMIGALNFATYGYISLTLASMAFTASKIGIAMNSTAYDLLSLPYFACNVFVFLQAVCSVGLIIYQFIIIPFSSSAILYASIIYDYVFMAVSIASMIPPFIFAARAAFSIKQVADERLIQNDAMNA